MYKNEGNFRQRSFAPIKVGDELDVKIEAVGEKGDGIAKVKGFVIFVPGAKKDENVKVRVTRVLRKVGFAEVIGKGSENAESSEDSYSEEGSKAEGEDQYSEDSNSEDSNSEEDSENF
ncbi:TRAM domain-containing protein [Candidatus Woesearchaeota archaeon]|nr:TRAM domain-containing protein [Candidatus Woesearchaeota archaeon]